MSAPRPSIPFYLLLLLVAGLVLSWWLAAWHLPPAEDATMLFRYSENLVDTGRISYNPGGPRAEGATDFLWMLAIAGGYALGLSSFQAALLLSLGGLLGTLWVQYRLAQGSLGRLTLLWLGWLLASQLWAAAQGFSVLFWGFSLWLGIYFWEKKDWRGLYLSGLLMALIRPDGLLIAAPLALGSLWLHPGQRRANLRLLLRWAILPGLAYFAWRVWYFGQWWPLPILVKGLSSSSAPGLPRLASLQYLWWVFSRLIGPLWLLAGIGFFRAPQSREKRMAVLVLSFWLLPAAFYSYTALEQNVAHRFALPFLVGALWLACRQTAWNVWQKALVLLFLMISTALYTVFFSHAFYNRYNQMHTIGQAWSQIPPHRLATTEAGHLPYYSGWPSLDAWGLNSPATAHHLVDQATLDSFAPQVIVLHSSLPFDSLLAQSTGPYRSERSWEAMNINLVKHACEKGDFQAWAVPHEAVQPWGGEDAFTLLANRLISFQEWYASWRRGPEDIVGDAAQPRFDHYLIRQDAPSHQWIEQVLTQHGGQWLGLLTQPAKANSHIRGTNGRR